MNRQTVKAVSHAPMKLIEPLFVSAFVVLLIGCSLAAGSRTTAFSAVPGIQSASAAIASVTAPAPQQVASIDR